MTIKYLSLDKIRLDGNTQNRKELEEWLIAEYQELYQNNVEMPVVEVTYDGSDYWLTDGFHRRWAAYRAGLDKLRCFITNGTQADAQWASYSANQSHGLRRTNADKELAVRRALHHPAGVELSDSAIAAHCGVDHKTVSKYRQEMESTREIPKLEKRVGKDGKARKPPRKKPVPAPAPVPVPAAEVNEAGTILCPACGCRECDPAVGKCDQCVAADRQPDDAVIDDGELLGVMNDDGRFEFAEDQQPFDLDLHSQRVGEMLEFFKSLFPPEHHGELAAILRRAADEIEKAK